jgi:hypothetical protein
MRKLGFLAFALCCGVHAQTVNVNVDVTSQAHPFSPLIFGVAFGDPARNAQMGYTVDRWGGNSTTRYNWQTDFSNHASDWYFENIPETPVTCTGSPSNSADAFIYCARAASAQPLLTMPTIGWTPRGDSFANHPYFSGFSVAKYGAQHSTDFSQPDAGGGTCDTGSNTTGYCNGGVITGNDPADTSIVAAPAFEAAWIAHLQSTFGAAASGGVKFYALDNEVMLWNSTHRDVHPNPPTYDEIWSHTLDYATAIKAQETTALVTGPVTWGYSDLFTSAKDATDCNCSDGNDRKAHNDLPFVAWYLQQVCANPLAGGKRLVDYLDLHYYPQDPYPASGSIYSNDADAATVGRRLRSLKELYDPNWVSESWIADLGDWDANHYKIPNLIPRVRAWIDAYCPGTKLAITEYAWDKDQTISGAVAQAEALAIFAREGVDMATRWGAPAANSLAERAFQIFLNFDGAGARVQGDSVAATSSNIDLIGAYAFHLAGKRTMVLLTNKDTATAHGISLTLNAASSGTWKLYGFDGSHALHQVNSGAISGNTVTLSPLPPLSANLLVLPDADVIFKNGFD